MNYTPEFLLWLSLSFSIMLFGVWFAYLYSKDKDKRKLMFSIAFFTNTIGLMHFLMEMVGYPIGEEKIFHTVYLWGGLVFLIAIFIAVNEYIIGVKDFDKVFRIFLLISICSLTIVVIPFDITEFILGIRRFIGLEILMAGIYQLYRTRSLPILLFVSALICFVIFSITILVDMRGYLSIFAAYMAHFFILLTVIVSYKEEATEGIQSYFSLKKKLQSTKKALQESEERYRVIVENTDDLIMLTKPDGTISYMSPSCKDVLGSPPESLINTKLWDSYPFYPDDVDRAKEIHYKALEGESGRNYEYRILSKDGEIKWVSHSWSPIVEDGKLKMVVSVIRDVTEKKKMEEELTLKIEELEKAEKASLNIMEDLQETIEELERAKKEVMEKNKQLEEAMEELQMINRELNVAREQLATLNKTLEEKVKQRTQEVEKLLKQKDEFIHQLGHDLKTPLTPLTTLLPIIRKKVDDPELQELLDTAIQSVNYMKNLVTKTLQLAKLNSPNLQFKLEDVKLREEVNEVLERNQNLFMEHNIAVENLVDENLIVKADKLRLSELLDNLISNAVKYSPNGGKVTIKAEDIGGEVKVSIQDTGMGMSREQLEHIFDEFYKADSSRHDFESSGLGLPICKRIVERHGGRIWAESPGHGKGSIFYFTLPNSAKQ